MESVGITVAGYNNLPQPIFLFHFRKFEQECVVVSQFHSQTITIVIQY
jgi:hypothetical protein